MLYGTIAVKNKRWNINIATNPWELTQGLGGLSDMPVHEGMLFDLGMPQTIQVTTVPMLFPLDIAFFSEDLKITEIYRDIQPGYLVTSTSPARYFLEVNVGELEEIEIGDQATVEFLSMQESVTAPDWMSVVISFMGIAVMSIFTTSIVRDLVKGLLEEPIKPKLLLQTKPFGKFTLRMDRMGNITIAHNKRPSQSVFLQFESDQELVYDLLRKSERKDLDAGWNIEIKDTEPRASILNELWETSSGLENLPQNLPVIHLLEKWRSAKARNSVLALRDLETLGPDYDTADCKQALMDYQGIERPDYSDQEEYQEAREEAWEAFLEALESLAGEEEETLRMKSQPAVVLVKGKHSKEPGLNYLTDSPEYLTWTIEDIGYRQKIDNAFLEAITRARSKK